MRYVANLDGKHSKLNDDLSALLVGDSPVLEIVVKIEYSQLNKEGGWWAGTPNCVRKKEYFRLHIDIEHSQLNEQGGWWPGTPNCAGKSVLWSK